MPRPPTYLVVLRDGSLLWDVHAVARSSAGTVSLLRWVPAL